MNRPRHCPWMPPWPTPRTAATTSSPCPPSWNRPSPMLDRSAGDLLQLLVKGEIFAEHLAHEHLKAIRRLDPKIKAFLHVDEESAIAQAKEIDARRRRGQPLGALGALAGLPIAV